MCIIHKNVCWGRHDTVDYQAFVGELGKAGLNVRQFAGLIGMNPNSVSNYANGEVPQHLALIAVLLGEMNIRGIDFSPIVSRVSLTPKKSRGRSKPGKFGGDKQEELDFR